MNREIREIRPFEGIDLGQILDHVTVGFGEHTCRAGSSITFQEDSLWFGQQTAVLHWGSEEKSLDQFRADLTGGVSQAGLDLSALSLLVTINSPYLKISDVVFDRPLSDLDSLPATVNLHRPPRPRALTAGVNGAVVTTYLLLNRTIGAQPLQPWRKGTWLARAIFRITTKLSHRLFRPEPLTPEDRKEHKLPPGTMRYLHMEGHNPLESYEDQDPPRFFVDKDLLDLLNIHKKSSAGAAVQFQLACDFLTAVIHASASRSEPDSDKTWSDLEGTLLGRVLRLIAKPTTPSEQEHLMRLVTDDPQKLIAMAEAEIGIRKQFLSTLREGTS